MGKDREISDFEALVYAAVKTIPRGEVRTYGWVAKRIGRPSAVRAVGNALHKNPFAPLVPCHRVVAQNGLGGFAGGREKKKRLLRSEGHPC
jgi:methylated-DNA-[protein]-cysteine S-methyltransferase